MNYLFREILENHAGEEAIDCLFSLCEATRGFIHPEDVNICYLEESEIESEFLWAVQQKFEAAYSLLDYLVGEEKAEEEYSEITDYIYLEYDPYNRGFRFDEEDSLNQFIDMINRGTTLKVLNISGNHTA